jgi:hypothetical protein
VTLAFTTIHEKPFTLPYYCGTDNNLYVASAVPTIRWMVQKFPVKGW